MNTNSHEVNIEMDTGAGVAIVCELVGNKITPNSYTVYPSPWTLKDYSGKNVGVKYGTFKELFHQ